MAKILGQFYGGNFILRKFGFDILVQKAATIAVNSNDIRFNGAYTNGFLYPCRM